MSVNKVNNDGTLTTLASGQRIWIGSKTAHQSLVSSGKMPNNVLVINTDAYTNGGENYSTEEQKIGTWIDGKPVYRKVFSYTTTSNNQMLDFTVNNIDTVVDMYGSVSSPRTSQASINLPIPYTLIDSQGHKYYAYTYIQGNLLRLVLNSDAEADYFPVGTKVSLIIEYTKTEN